jgi:hypothetical protein
MMECPACRFDNRPGRRFCAKCATPLVLICPSCSAANEPGEDYCGECAAALIDATAAAELQPTTRQGLQVAQSPSTFAQGRYHDTKLLGEGGKKRVFEVHDTHLGRDVAFAIIRTEV